MKVVILLGGYGTRMRPHTWSRPKPLLNVAGNTVLGHILDLMHEITTEEVVFVVGYKGDMIEAWVRENYPHLDSHFVVQEQALGQAHAVWLCRDFLDAGEVVIAFGDGIIKADFAHFASDGDATFLVQEVEDPRIFGVVALDEAGFVSRFVEKPATMENRMAVVGINWFRDAAQLRQAIDIVMEEGRMTKGEYFMADAYEVLLEQGAKFRVAPVAYWLDAGNPRNILNTNRQLLQNSAASPDAAARAAAEGFTLLPPVYLHPDAQVAASVVGPYATIGAGATVTNSIVSDCIIDAGASVQTCILKQTLVGQNARVTGRALQLFVGDNSAVESGG